MWQSGEPLVVNDYDSWEGRVPDADYDGTIRAVIGVPLKSGAQVIGVSPDSVASHDKFCKKHELDIILLADESKDMLDAYGVWKEKSMYGKTYMGVERTTVLIDSKGKIARIWPKVKVAGHAEEVLKAAQDLK